MPPYVLISQSFILRTGVKIMYFNCGNKTSMYLVKFNLMVITIILLYQIISHNANIVSQYDRLQFWNVIQRTQISVIQLSD